MNSCDLYNFPGYKMINNCRPTRGGGVSILLQDKFSYKERKDLCIMNEYIETVFVEAWLRKKVLIGVIYRPPDKPIKEFNEEFKVLLEKISESKLPCHLLGDLNINLLNSDTHHDTSD